ncbi:hypothetical protein ACFLYJ_01515 [Candidatus Cloacimonadota bacterium]
MQPVEKKETFTSYSFPFDDVDRKIDVPRFKKKMYQIKAGPKDYPWPCDVEPNRTITVTTDDLFSKTKDGTVIKHTGVGCYGILIPDDDLEEIFD